MTAVLVHGAPDTFRVWDPVHSHMERMDAMAIALPGFDSPVPDGFNASKEVYLDWSPISRKLEPLWISSDTTGDVS